MNTKIFLYPFKLYSFFSKKISTSYTEGGQEYLVFLLEYSVGFEKGREFAYLLVPDDNSVFVSHLKKNGIAAEEAEAKEQLDNCFSTSLDNLKFRPDFSNGKGTCEGRGLSIKNPNEVKKVEKFTNNETPFTSITFQVNKSVKTKLNKLYPEASYHENSTGYAYELEIEPLSLGIEGLPKITRLVFVLFEKINPSLDVPNWKDLPLEVGVKESMEIFQEKYEELVANAAGKKLTLEIKKWTFTSQDGRYNTLEFQNSEQFGQITEAEKEEKPKPEKENSNQPSNSSQKSPEVSNHENKETDNKPFWIAIIIFGIGLSLLLIYWFMKKPNNKKINDKNE